MIIKILPIILFFIVTLNANQKVTLYLDWLNQFQFAGYYIAKEKGYYKDLGIDIEIKEFQGDYNSIIKNVVSNETIYAIGKSSLILDNNQDKNIILLSTIFQKSPLILLTLESSNIKTPKDLENKKVMITSDAKESASVNAMILSQGLNLNSVNFLEHTFDINDLLNKKVDAYAGYLSNEPYLLDKKNIKYNIINPSNYNFDFFEGILFTSKKELSNNPTRVLNFNEASLKGWEYAFNNIEESVKIIYEKYNTQNKTLDELIFEANILKDLSNVKEETLGTINLNKINEINSFYKFLGLNAQNNFDAESLIFDKTKVLLNKDINSYLRDNQFTLLIENNKIPYSFKITNEQVGIEIDFWNLLSEKTNKAFNIEERLSTKNLNIFTNNIKVQFKYSTKPIKNNKFVYTNSIAKIPIVMATKDNKNLINNLEYLSNVTVGISEKLDLIKELQQNYPKINFIELNSVDNAFNKLKNDEIYGFIDDIYSISHKINYENIKNIKIVQTLQYNLNIYLESENINKPFINLLNIAISKLTNEEKNNILNAYQQILYHDKTNIIEILKYIVPLFFLLSIFMFLNYKLNSEIKKRKNIEKELLKLANKDSLTNIYNRRKIEEICENEIDRNYRYNTIFSIIFFDLNDFKPINDKLGHHIGDEVLINVAQTIKKNIRNSDSLGRWGGDEFLIILPETNLEQAKKTVTHLEKKVSNIIIDSNKNLKISCSFGVAQYKKNDSFDSLMEKADKLMYASKTIYKNKKKG